MLLKTYNAVILIPQIEFEEEDHRWAAMCYRRLNAELLENGSRVKFAMVGSEDRLTLYMDHRCATIIRAIVEEIGFPHIYWQVRTWRGTEHCIAWREQVADRTALLTSLQAMSARNRWWLFGYKKVQRWQSGLI
ncbi:hypothetical protein HOB10_01065 [Candidatus Parcubacteria bacterium]|jgi:hypothetical protein|nr:hypothetical protein [Candidatus Parcubacteria bacterium]